MSSKYWDIPMNFIGGCSPCNVGCAHCWAADCASKRLANLPLYKGLTKNGKWTGEVRVMPELIKVIGGKPKTIFWCNMSDMFHEKVRFEDIDTAFEAMFNMPQHTHLILTKRVEQMAEYFSAIQDGWIDFGENRDSPPPFIHLGATICTQKEADEILPIALQIPGFDWISIEPMLEEIDILQYLPHSHYFRYPRFIKWIVCGCESGPKRRPCKLEHIMSVVQQCKAAGIPVFVKQMEINGKVEHDMSKFPEWARVREPI